MYRETVLAFFGVRDEKDEAGRRDQGVGEYCEGRDVEECKAAFGDALPLICSTCPN